VPSNDQLGFVTSTATERHALGGNRSGKSKIAVWDCIAFALGEHPVWSKKFEPPVKIRYCVTSWEHGVEGVILPIFKEMVPHYLLAGGSWDKAWRQKSSTIQFANGSTVTFRTFEQSINKFGGSSLHAVYSDEHGPKRYYTENKARLADYGGFYVSSMTPEEGAITWERKHLKRRRGDNCDVFTFTTFGNPYLSPDGVREMQASIDDPRVLRVKMYGEFAALAGLIYEQFDESLHVIPRREIPDSWYRVFAIDPHIKKATAMVWAAWSPDDELFIYRAEKETLTVDELKKYIRAKSAGERISLFIGDEALGGDGLNIFGQPSVLKQLSSGVDRIPVIPTNQSSDKSFEAGVNRIREMLTPDAVSHKPDIYVFNDLYGVIDEFEEYQFTPESKADELTFRERVRKIDDDYMDCIRYIAMAGAQGQRRGKIKSRLSENWG
jgi:phage terminase large subunit-like protein